MIYKFNFISFLLLSSQVLANYTTVTVLDPKLAAIEGVVVYLSPLDKSSVNSHTTQTLIISQNNKKFTPYIAVLQKGQKIKFKNQDDVTHHIYSVSGQNRFDFKVKAGGHKDNINISTAGEIAMGCNIHDWMSGYVLVVDTPYFNKTTSSGISNFENIPSGNYKLTIWHPQLETNNNEFVTDIMIQKTQNFKVTLPKALLPIPVQQNQDEFDFLEGY
ncbi:MULTISPECIES: cupredoxin domain-containing protein [unclassified Pseudoalteromonas]|uniref:cupredoxin domain-containing protein n=1 Tax=unclassified Pseudoalteromonas TaxID=194690 RepID=UPI000693CC1E|nr:MULTISPECIES: cupredoxin domain-containing protein [unclassified Pseudoalteromonas]